MGFGVVNGALLQCAFGMTPSVLTVLPESRVFCGGMPAANIMDYQPFVNICPFGMCTCPANPAVAAATAAALGVPTPAPCMPVLLSPWMPGNPALLIGGMYPALTQESKLICSYGGIITINTAGQFSAEY
ncbi:DUF4280 domain-containing protein [Caproicibacter sp.]|uniref:DUF4280 domain-containing protein n=1 Tax=Caproicibacter sp. TaxID=2814884 RepID=UPI00398A401A